MRKGDGFREIAERLEDEGFIKSSQAFKLFLIISGRARDLKPGIYKLNSNLGALQISSLLVKGEGRTRRVTIREGASIFEIDKILSSEGIIEKGSLIKFSNERIEGYLYPDTYEFFVESSIDAVVAKFIDNFKKKAEPLLKKDPENFYYNLIVASMLQREVPDYEEQRIVAGIIKKRIAAHMPLQIDSTICYIKEKALGNGEKCRLSPLDFKVDSPYNTYLHKGLPPTPIGNPGFSAIKAALNPISSPYWFYLSDPKTKKTIFSRTLREHEYNRSIYLF